MNDYEMTFVLYAEEERFKNGKEQVKKELEQVGAKIEKEEDLGDRSLAYPIKKEERGHYLYFETQISPEKVSDLDKSLKLATDVLKYLFIRKDNKKNTP